MRRIPAPPFEDHLTPEIMLLLAGSVVVTSIFLPLAVKDSAIGWVGSVIGISGVIALFIMSILSERGSRYSFESFRLSIFLFFVMLGITAGLFIGLIHKITLAGYYRQSIGSYCRLFPRHLCRGLDKLFRMDKDIIYWYLSPGDCGDGGSEPGILI